MSDLLRFWALAEWYDKLLARASDRGEVLNRLRELVREDPQLLTPHLQHTLRNLESTLVVRRSKPGSIEAMVDELTEHWEDTDTLERNDDAFWALAALGFDAVPVLIEHLTDERLTRTQFRGFNNFGPYIYRVNHFASRLLGELSGGRLINFEERGDSIDPGEALKWWGTVRQLSEENWLLDHVLPELTKGSPRSPRKVILRAIRAKYPHRLREVYQAILLKRPDIDSERVVAEIAASVLPREHKIKLLEEGASHRDPAHRRDALVALAKLDGAAFRRCFVRAMRELPETIPNPPEGQVSDVAFLWAMFAVEDRVCWDAVLATARCAAPGDRLRFMEELVWWEPWSNRPEAARREHIRCLLGFRDDVATGEYHGDRCSVRDCAAMGLAFELDGMRPLTFEFPASPRERSLFRARMRALAERELARAEK